MSPLVTYLLVFISYVFILSSFFYLICPCALIKWVPLQFSGSTLFPLPKGCPAIQSPFLLPCLLISGRPVLWPWYFGSPPSTSSRSWPSQLPGSLQTPARSSTLRSSAPSLMFVLCLLTPLPVVAPRWLYSNLLDDTSYN